MHIVSILGAILVVVTTLTGCASRIGQNPSRPQPTLNTSVSASTSESDQPAVKPVLIYELNQPASAGGIVHTVSFIEKLETIPASSTIPAYDLIAQESPAADGFVWLHAKGTVLNNSKKSQTVNSLSFVVLDSKGNEFEPVTTDTILYVDENKVPVSLSVQPTQSVEWETYFLVPKDSQTLQLRATDLSYLPKNTVLINLGL